MKHPSDMTPAIDLTAERGTGPSRSRHPVWRDLLPPCNNACPAGENIQAWLALAQAGPVSARRGRRILRDNPLPAVHGRVCYHPCETRLQSRRAGRRRQHPRGRALPRRPRARRRAGRRRRSPTPSGKRVLVVGAGPSGLSAAYHLARLGHTVEIHEAGPVAGGMMHFGIPAYRLPRAQLLARDRAHRAHGRDDRASTARSRICCGGDAGRRLRRRVRRHRRAHLASTSTSPPATRRACSTRSATCATFHAASAAAARPARRRLWRRQHRDGRGAHGAAPGRRRGADRLSPRPRAHAGARVRGRRGDRRGRQDPLADHDQGHRRRVADRRAHGASTPTAARCRPASSRRSQADAVVLALGQDTDSGFLRAGAGHRVQARRHRRSSART